MRVDNSNGVVSIERRSEKVCANRPDELLCEFSLFFFEVAHTDGTAVIGSVHAKRSRFSNDIYIKR